MAVVEGKGTRDPLERPFAGRRMSAVDQAYHYAINLSCDWIILSDLVNQASGLTPAEIDLMWKTAPPRMPILPPAK